MDFSTSSLVSFLIALSFAAGLNLYATIAVLGLLARFHASPLPHGLEMIASTWVIVASLVLFAMEFFADKIPFVDVVWSAAHTFIRIPAAALIAFKASEQLSPEMQMLVTIMGAAIAAVAHGSKTAVRTAVTASPEPVSNFALSSSEDVAAIALTWVATHHPFIAGSAALATLVLCLVAVRWIWKRLAEALRQWQTRGRQALVVR